MSKRVDAPQVQTPIVLNGLVAPVWGIFFTQVFEALKGPFALAAYSVAKLPDATKNEGAMIYVSDESGGKTIAFSDGTNWLRVQDRQVVS